MIGQLSSFGVRAILAVLALLLGLLTPAQAVPPPVPAPIEVIAPALDHDQGSPDVIVFLAAYRANGPPSGHGRVAFIFFLVGRSTHSGGWREYAYAGGDPVNRWDPSGLDWRYYDGVEGLVRGGGWFGADKKTPGFWGHIPGTDPTVPKPRDDLLPADVGLTPGDNVFTWIDYNRENGKPVIPKLLRYEGGYKLDAYHYSGYFDRAYQGGDIEYGPSWNRINLHVPAQGDFVDALHEGVIGAVSVIANNPGVGPVDLGSRLIRGKDLSDNLADRRVAALELVATAAGGYGLIGIVSNKFIPIRTTNIAPKTNVWGDFQRANSSRYSTLGSSDEAYSRLLYDQSPWPDGYVPQTVTLKTGDRIYMAMGPGQPSTRPGAFGTTTDIPNVNFARSELAIKIAWKPSIDKVVTFEVTNNMPVLSGPIGPQIDLRLGRYLPGGQPQIQIPGAAKDRMRNITVVDERQIK